MLSMTAAARPPLFFEANQGQTDPEVRFLARSGGYTLLLTPTEAVLALKGPAAVRMKLAGDANAAPEIVGEDPVSGIPELDEPARAAEALETALRSPQADFAKYGNAYLQVAGAHVSLGKAYLESGDAQRAIRCFERALAIEPTAQAHVHLANAKLQQGDAAAAEQHYREAIRLGLDVAAVHFSLGKVLWAENRREEAAREYEATLRLDPDHQEAHQNLGVWLSSLGRRAIFIIRFSG